MLCKTPGLQLPPEVRYQNQTAPEFQIGFTFDGFDEYRELSEEEHNISSDLTVVKLLLEEHRWPPYEASSNVPLELMVHYFATILINSDQFQINSNQQVSWGPFQHEIEVFVSGVSCNITERYGDRILFLPPMEEDIKQSIKYCNDSTGLYPVEVE